MTITRGRRGSSVLSSRSKTEIPSTFGMIKSSNTTSGCVCAMRTALPLHLWPVRTPQCPASGRNNLLKYRKALHCHPQSTAGLLGSFIQTPSLHAQHRPGVGDHIRTLGNRAPHSQTDMSEEPLHLPGRRRRRHFPPVSALPGACSKKQSRNCPAFSSFRLYSMVRGCLQALQR